MLCESYEEGGSFFAWVIEIVFLAWFHVKLAGNMYVPRETHSMAIL